MRQRQRAAWAFEIGRVDLGVRRTDQRPQLDPAGLVLPAGQMGHAPRLGDAAGRLGLAEHPIDGIQHRGCRAERDVELDRHEILHGDAALFGEPFAHLLELARIGALEAEDRLLGVADGEHGAAALDRAFAHEEFLGQAADHLPLVGVGVLRFVDQHMVDAAIELVEHPGRARRALQQAPRGHDQIVIVERRAPPLGVGIAAGDVETEPQQRQGVLDQRRAADAIEHLGQPLGLAAEHACRCRASPLSRPWWRAVLRISPVGREERLGIGGEERRPVLDRCQPVGDRAARARRPSCRPWPALVRRRAGPRHRRRHRGRRCCAGCRRCRRASSPSPRPVAPARGAIPLRRRCAPAARPARPKACVISSAYSAIEIRLATAASASTQGGRRIAAGQRLHLLVLGMTQQGLRLGLVEHLEARRHAGLERKALEQRLAEGMDGEDVDAARRVEHAREQAARQRRCSAASGGAIDQLLDLLVQLGLLGQRPAAELRRPDGCASRRRPPW